MFSYAFFLKGLTGLAKTNGSIVTHLVVMNVTVLNRWADKISLKTHADAAGELT